MVSGPGRNLEEMLLNIEVYLNDTPLCYVEDDVEFAVLTPNALMFQRTNAMPEEQPHHYEEIDLRGRAMYQRKYKDSMRAKWSKEYLRGLRERYKILTTKENKQKYHLAML